MLDLFQRKSRVEGGRLRFRSPIRAAGQFGMGVGPRILWANLAG